MAHPLLSLARKLEQRREALRLRHDLNGVINDPHIARDVGLPYVPTPKPRIDRW